MLLVNGLELGLELEDCEDVQPPFHEHARFHVPSLVPCLYPGSYLCRRNDRENGHDVKTYHHDHDLENKVVRSHHHIALTSTNHP